MRVILKGLIIVLLVLQNGAIAALAQPPEEEVDQLLAELGWKMTDLESYLAYYELTLNDFETMEDLQAMLGTPITPENLDSMLEEYDLTREELDILLEGFGESVEKDYFFLEDLELALAFYQDHDNLMKQFESFLTTIGVTENEADALFTHFMALDQTDLETRMEQVGGRLESLMLTDPEAEITEEQKTEILGIWQEILTTVQLAPRFYLVDNSGGKTPIAFNALADMESLPSSALLLELYNLKGTRLLDLQVSAEMLDSQFVLDAGEKLTDIGDLAGELTHLKHEKLPDTASPYLANILIGLAAFLAGAAWFLFAWRKEKRV
ncbi:processed acidic surface protein [Mesobacillus foraminis]|uniref:Processed acidic surface protein n=1 Tax=Mesobacillus foraminis TaxID=279826 RepID=A0A4R2BKC3_9BACI|nr:processed acidic surface protein [Mesobacillus foraminis]TCN27103.1 processed acidic surface protein [Mesobacillus foraminis]